MPSGIQDGSTEVDLVLQSDDSIVFIEAKLGAKPSYGTTYDSSRNQLVRNLDVGFNRATREQKRFALIYLTPDITQPDIVNRTRTQENLYPANPSTNPQLITQCLFWTSWSSLGDVITEAYKYSSLTSTEKKFALDLLTYLAHKRLWENTLNDEKLFYDDKLYRSLQKSESPFVPYISQRPDSDESWRSNTDWTETELNKVLQNLPYKQKALLKTLSKNDGVMKQGLIFNALPFLKKSSKTLSRIKSYVNAACKAQGKAPILSVGIGNRDQRIHEINSDLGALKQFVIEEAKQFTIPRSIIG
jgi:hypothetical protein